MRNGTITIVLEASRDNPVLAQAVLMLICCVGFIVYKFLVFITTFVIDNLIKLIKWVFEKRKTQNLALEDKESEDDDAYDRNGICDN